MNRKLQPSVSNAQLHGSEPLTFWCLKMASCLPKLLKIAATQNYHSCI